MSTGVKDVPRRASKKLAWASLGVALAAVPLVFLSPYLSPWPAVVFIVSALSTSIAASHKAISDPSRYAGLRIARSVQAAFVLLFLSLVIPSLLRTRVSHPNPRAIGDLRSLSSAMQTYQTANGGFYESRLECLVRPGLGDCIPDYPPTGPVFLGEEFLETERGGYLYTLYPGSGPDEERQNQEISPSSINGFAYTALPTNTRNRQLCVDASGRLCALPGDAMMTVTRAECPSSCPDLQ